MKQQISRSLKPAFRNYRVGFSAETIGFLVGLKIGKVLNEDVLECHLHYLLNENANNMNDAFQEHTDLIFIGAL